MLEKNKADSRKYFIFKIRDLVHNSFHTLEEKRTESLLQYMGMMNLGHPLTQPN